ncbi:MAG: hypothetical protein WCB16_04430 [Candidatus Binatus sp.]
MRMIVPPVAHRREIDRNLAEFFRGHRTARFNRAISSMCRYFNVRRPRIEWFEYIDWGKTAGRTYEDGRIHLVHPENWKRGRIYFSERKWIQMLYHEMGHFILWSDAERKADLFSRRMINGLRVSGRRAASRSRTRAGISGARGAANRVRKRRPRISIARKSRRASRIASRRVTARKSRRVA